MSLHKSPSSDIFSCVAKRRHKRPKRHLLVYILCYHVNVAIKKKIEFNQESEVLGFHFLLALVKNSNQLRLVIMFIVHANSISTSIDAHSLQMSINSHKTQASPKERVSSSYLLSFQLSQTSSQQPCPLSRHFE